MKSRKPRGISFVNQPVMSTKNSSKTAIDRPGSAQGKSLVLITKYREDYKNKRDESAVYLFVYLNSKRVKFNTGVYVKKEFWDPQTELIRKDHPQAADLNLIITSCRARISDVFVRYRLQHKQLTIDLLKKEYTNPSFAIDFLAWMQSAIGERAGEITESSLNQHRAHLSKLREFKDPLTFSELTEDFFTEYARHLKTKLHNNQNTRHNSLKTIRTYINIARRKGLILDNPLRRMPVKRTSPDREFLDDDELESLVKLYQKRELPDSYHRILRHYLFCCFTGIRISDLRLIRMDDIISGTLVLIPKKTRNVNAGTVKIPLGRIALELIRDEAPVRLHGLIFNLYSEPKTREYLKLILKHAHINRPMSFHSSRHTFATVFLRNTKNIAALQKLLGHSRIDQTMVYAHILTEDIANEMKVFDKF